MTEEKGNKPTEAQLRSKSFRAKTKKNIKKGLEQGWSENSINQQRDVVKKFDEIDIKDALEITQPEPQPKGKGRF